MRRAEYIQRHKERREKILAAVREGDRPYYVIGAEYGITGERVSQIAKEAGIHKRRSSPRKPRA